MSKKKRTRRRLIITAIIGILFVGVCIGVAYIMLMASIAGLGSAFQNDCPVSEPHTVEDWGRYKLPPSARILTSECGGGVGVFGHSSFEMNPKDLKVFLLVHSSKTRFQV